MAEEVDVLCAAGGGERADLSACALAKFEESNSYAPKRGRLRLQWGNALIHSGKPDEAEKQFARLASLELSSTDRRAVEFWTSIHD